MSPIHTSILSSSEALVKLIILALQKAHCKTSISLRSKLTALRLTTTPSTVNGSLFGEPGTKIRPLPIIRQYCFSKNISPPTMDPATSILTIIEEAWKIAKYISDVHEGHKERKQLREEIVAVFQFFLNIQDQFVAEGWESDNVWSRAIRPLFRTDGVIEQLRKTLSEVAERLILPKQDALKKVGRALKWPFEKDEIQGLTTRIHSSLQMITTALTQANLEVGEDTHTNVSEIKDILQAQELQNVHRWTSRRSRNLHRNNL